MANKKDILNGYILTGSPAPVVLIGDEERAFNDIAILGADEPGYSAGNVGLNYLFPKPVSSPIDDVYCPGCSNDAIEREDELGFLDNIFPCLNACRGMGAEKKKCLADCRGRLSRGQRKTLDAQNDAKIAAAMQAMANQPSAQAGSNTGLYILLAFIVLLAVGATAFFVIKRKAA